MQIYCINLTSYILFLYLPLRAYLARSFTSNDSDRFALVFHERYIAVYCDDLSDTFARSCFLFPSFSMRHRVRVTGSTPDSAFSAVLLIFPWRRTRYSVPDCDKGGAAVTMDPSVLATMDKDALKKQIENMKYQASMERWPLSKSIAA